MKVKHTEFLGLCSQSIEIYRAYLNTVAKGHYAPHVYRGGANGRGDIPGFWPDSVGVTQKENETD